MIFTLVHTILTATFHRADASDPGWTSNSRCFGWPTASLAVLIVRGKKKKELIKAQKGMQSWPSYINLGVQLGTAI